MTPICQKCKSEMYWNYINDMWMCRGEVPAMTFCSYWLRATKEYPKPTPLTQTQEAKIRMALLECQKELHRVSGRLRQAEAELAGLRKRAEVTFDGKPLGKAENIEVKES